MRGASRLIVGVALLVAGLVLALLVPAAGPVVGGVMALVGVVLIVTGFGSAGDDLGAAAERARLDQRKAAQDTDISR